MKNQFEMMDYIGYQIVINGHAAFPSDVCKKLDRLDYLEMEMLKKIKKDDKKCDFCGKKGSLIVRRYHRECHERVLNGYCI